MKLIITLEDGQKTEGTVRSFSEYSHKDEKQFAGITMTYNVLLPVKHPMFKKLYVPDQFILEEINERYDNALSDRGYVEFDIETEISVITSYREIEQNRLDLMIVLLSYCRLQRCIDKFGNVHDVSSTEFAREFNTLFSSMLSDFEDACDFRVTHVERRI